MSILPEFRATVLSAALCFAALMAGSNATSAEEAEAALSAETLRLSAGISEKVDQAGLSVIIGVGRIGTAPEFQEFGAFADDHLAPAETLVDLGSNTKAVTAAVVLKHVERGVLSLEDTLGTLLADVPSDKQAITLRQLLTHRAGLPDAVGSDGEKIGRAAYLARVLRTRLISEPGTTYAYSNVGYGLLAAILEKKTGQAFEVLLARTLYPDAAVPEIGYELTYREDASAISGRVWLTLFQRLPIHRASWGGTPVGWNLIGNGGAVATPADAMTFYEDLVTGRLVDMALWQQGFVHGNEIPTPKSYGFGIVRLQFSDGVVVYTHSGANIVFSVDWRYYPNSGVTIFIAGLEDEAGEAMDIVADQVRALNLR